MFLAIQLIIGLGLLTIWRLDSFFGFKQTLWMIFSTLTIGLVIGNQSILEYIREYKNIIFISGIILIILTFFFGTYPGGSGPKLWLGSRGIYFQPSELLKIILIFYLSAYFAETQEKKFDTLQNLFPTILLALGSFSLLVFQHDLGTASIFLSIYILIVFSVYRKKRILLISVVILLIITILGYSFIDLVRIRFQAWIYPWNDPQTSSYQIIQSIISIAAGGLFGTGFGLGYPNLVPLSHSDFIFSAIAEEMGVIGSVGLLSLYVIILFQGIRTSLHARDRYQQYLSIGIVIYLLTQTILIIGGNVRLLPITGVTLPFVSYGGSSLLISYIAFGILLIISNNSTEFITLEEKPYRIIAAFFSFCLVAIAITISWWGFIHANDIQLRSDNPRNLIANVFVKRGDILDRNNKVLATSTGTPGYIQRRYPYPALSNTVGYIDQKYGLAGIEKSYDSYLRGQKGYRSLVIWQSYLLYDQPPEGRPIRLTIDIDLQKLGDQLLEDKNGGLVVLNAESGEILAISTSPHFDANDLKEKREHWQTNEDSPFLNRAIQGAYPVGGLLSPLLLFENDLVTENSLSDFVFLSIDERNNLCSRDSITKDDFGQILRNGCYRSVLDISKNQDPASAFAEQEFNFIFNAPDVGLPMPAKIVIAPNSDWIDLLYGTNQIRSNPLQIAVSFTPLSNGGFQVNPFLVSAVNISSGDWVFINEGKQQNIISSGKAEEIVNLLRKDEANTWAVSAVTYDNNGEYYWYITGTGNNAIFNDYVIAIVVENSSRDYVIYAGSMLMKMLQGN